jgi:hypothetical protein
MLGKNGIFRGKGFEKSLFQEIPRNFPRKVIFCGKKCMKIGPIRSPWPTPTVTNVRKMRGGGGRGFSKKTFSRNLPQLAKLGLENLPF